MYEVFFVKFMGDWVEDVCVDWFLCFVDEYCCVLVEVDVVVVVMVLFFVGLDDYGFDYVIFFDVVIR